MPRTRSRSSQSEGARQAPPRVPAVVGGTPDAEDGRSPLAMELSRGLKLVHDLRGSLGAVLLMLDLAARGGPAAQQRKRIEGIAAALRASCDELTNVSSLLASGAEATKTTVRRHGLAGPDA